MFAVLFAVLACVPIEVKMDLVADPTAAGWYVALAEWTTTPSQRYNFVWDSPRNETRVSGSTMVPLRIGYNAVGLHLSQADTLTFRVTQSECPDWAVVKQAVPPKPRSPVVQP